MVRRVYKQYYRCSSQTTAIVGEFGGEEKLLWNSITFNGLRTGAGTYTSAPAWFFQSNGFPLYDVFWVFTPPAESNSEYVFSWTSTNKDGTQTEYVVILSMIDYCEVDLGCRNETETKPLSVLHWLTREGGWCYFPFNGKKSFEVKIPEAEKYRTASNVMYQYSRDGVMRGEVLSTGSIPVEALDLLESLKTSIQVYYVDNYFDTDNQIVTPVMLLDGDFVKRETDDRRWIVNVRFVYSEILEIQKQ